MVFVLSPTLSTNYYWSLLYQSLGPVYLTLGAVNITTNNTDILITDIGNSILDQPSLTCHTDLVACCRNSDTGGNGGRGMWLYPNGTALKNNAGGEAFFSLRNAPQVIELNRRDTATSPTGLYCCVIPIDGGGEQTFCANLGNIIIM